MHVAPCRYDRVPGRNSRLRRPGPLASGKQDYVAVDASLSSALRFRLSGEKSVCQPARRREKRSKASYRRLTPRNARIDRCRGGNLPVLL